MQTNHNLQHSNFWIQLCPFGKFPHQNITQYHSPHSAEILVNHFDNSKDLPIPIYIGHPDDPLFSSPSQQNTLPPQPIGFVSKLAKWDDGIYFQSSWTPEGLDIISQQLFHYLSPRWKLQRALDLDSLNIYEPFELISIGLTNSPNLPLSPLTHSNILSNINTLFPPITPPSPPQPHPLPNSFQHKPLSLPTKSRTQNLNLLSPYSDQNYEFIDKVHSHMRTTGDNYSKSWNLTKQKFPHLFSQIKQPFSLNQF